MKWIYAIGVSALFGAPATIADEYSGAADRDFERGRRSGPKLV